MTLTLAAWSLPAAAQPHEHGGDWGKGPIRHVLLISVDGMHAVDYINCRNGIGSINGGVPYCPHLAELGTTGLNYTGSTTTRPSDSFPGLMGIITGGTPRTMGVYYDVAYDRYLAPPAITTGNGVAGGTCTPNVANGTTTEYEEGIDYDQTLLNGGASGATLTDGTAASINPARLPRDPGKNCAPVYPWNFVRTNTIFGVIHAANGYTAWTDKHPAYSSVNGPGAGKDVDDFYAPEINSSVVPLPGVTTPLGLSCATVPDPTADLTSWTNSFVNVQCYDTLKVNAILNQINGKNHLGTAVTKVPTLFGMNFQVVSVAQKLIDTTKSPKIVGGYLDAMGTPTASLLSEIQFVDKAVGNMLQQLKNNGLYESTLIVITAKHGQSPIDPNRYFPIPGKTSNGTSPATLLDNNGYIPYSEAPSNATGIGPTEDDVSLLWLKNTSDTAAAVALLEDPANTKAAGIGQIYYGASLYQLFDTPGLEADTRTPDIAITPNVGVAYTGSSKKLAEHGGFSHDDTNVVLLLSNPAFEPKRISTPVETIQIAPTILKLLGLDPAKLDSVQIEGTAPLPDVKLY